MSKYIEEMDLEELQEYNQSLCVNHFLDRLDFPTNTNEKERRWYADQFKRIKIRKEELKEKGV
jgi:hypothetical protein